MRLPLVKGKQTEYPSSAKCPQCKKHKVREPHSFVSLAGGALLLDRKRENSKDSDSLSGFLDLIWHGAHDHGVGDDRDLFRVLRIAEDAVGGQFSLYFCSTACLRAFVNSLVDALEKRIQRDKKQQVRDDAEQQRTGKLPKRVQKELDDMVRRGVVEVRPKSGPPRSSRKRS
jgi:hypothetical protein